MSNPKPGKAEFTVQGACFECMCMGFFVSESGNHGLQVERCDTCQVFRYDEDARAHALRLAVQALKSPRKRTGKRFKMLLECLEVTADQMDPPFWESKPTPAALRQIVTNVNNETKGEATLLGIAYALQGLYIHWPTGGDDHDRDNEYVRENLDRDELTNMLVEAGCTVSTWDDGEFWRATRKKSA